MPVKHDVCKYGAGAKVRLAVMAGWFEELSHVEMVEQVAAYGFAGFEQLGCWSWEDKEAVRRRCAELGVEVGGVGSIGSINGDGPVNLAYHDTFEALIRQRVAEAQALGSRVLVSVVGGLRSDISWERQMDNLVTAYRRVAPLVEDAGIMLTIEPLNIRCNHAGYALVYSQDAAALIERIGSPQVKMLFDVYHQQISEGDVIVNLTRYAPLIGHYHFGDNPGRHEPGTGELNYRNIFKAIAATGYTGLISAEFSKTAACSTDEVLRILGECASW